MKPWMFIILVLTLVSRSLCAHVAIVTNATGNGTAEDSITVAFVVTDSIGNVASADSFYIALFGPTGDSVYGGGYAEGAPEISSMVVGGRLVYRWTMAVADIDGGGRRGSYAGIVIAVDTLSGTGPEYLDGVAGFSFVLSPSLAERVLIGDTINREASTLTPSSRIGVDLDNVAGALDSFELGAGAITSSVIADNAVRKWWECDTGSVSAGMAAMLKDTSAYQGPAADLDSSTVAGWVWNTPQANHNTGGTFGRYLDAPVSAVSAGTGAKALRVVSYDRSIDAVIPYAGVRVRNVERTALLAVGRTSANGSVVFNVDADTCVVDAFVSGYTFSGFDTVVLNDHGVDTIVGQWFDPGTPAQPNLCRVYGHVYGVDGAPLAGVAVTASLPKGTARSGAAVISPVTVDAQTDESGYFFLDLIPSSALQPGDTRYELTITQSGSTIFRRRMLVPDMTSWRLDWSD